MDQIDKKIIACLKENSRLSWKEIGERVYLTGQAVGARVQQLEDDGTIQKYTIQTPESNQQFITVFMNSNEFIRFEKLVSKVNEVIEFHKITGDGCYLIKSTFDKQHLEDFLKSISVYARYRINESLRQIK